MFCSGVVRAGGQQKQGQVSVSGTGVFSGPSAGEEKGAHVDQRVGRATEAAAALVLSLGCAETG